MAQYQDHGGRHKWVVMGYERCVQEAHRQLIEAADEWAAGNPEDPPTQEVLRSILDLFAKHGFLKPPFGAKSGGS
jgi:hypothetical protein